MSFRAPEPEFRQEGNILLAGIMAIYDSHADAAANIPKQWQELMSRPSPEIRDGRPFYGASPCTPDHKIHYLCGVALPNYEGVTAPARLTLEAGEYVVFTVNDIADLRDTWVWALTKWLPGSGRKERHAPEFERYTAGALRGPIEVCIPLEPL